MAITLRVTPEELVGAAGKITEAVKSAGQSLDRIEMEAGACPGFWEGAAGKKHQEICRRMMEQAREALKRIEGYPPRILQMAELYTSAEESSRDTVDLLSNEIL